MKIAVAKEMHPEETRVALVPDSVKQLVAKQLQVTIEAGAGHGYFTDEEFRAAGARIETSRESVFREAEVIVKLNPPSKAGEAGGDEVARMREGQVLISFLHPYTNTAQVRALAAKGVTAFAMEMIPRISRAQNMDALTSMATVAGYRAVLLAAEVLPRFFPMLMTAAGTMTPARVLVIGAGVAGLQAIATARRLGAVVEAFDTRPVVKEQVESLGARFVGPEMTSADAQDAGGYAKELPEEHQRKERELIGKLVTRADVVITTAQVPGKRAPLLITKAMVESMKRGSVIMDMAAETGGNCELTRPGKRLDTHGIVIFGYADLPRFMPVHASQMYARNVYNLLVHLIGPEGLKLDLDDPITSGTMVTHGGAVTHPALK
jgi:NAD(P) transhydrogenase subunit alpha